MTLRERCEKFYIHMPGPDNSSFAVDELESFAREIARQAREETLEEAANRLEERKAVIWDGHIYWPASDVILSMRKDPTTLASTESENGN